MKGVAHRGKDRGGGGGEWVAACCSIIERWTSSPPSWMAGGTPPVDSLLLLLPLVWKQKQRRGFGAETWVKKKYLLLFRWFVQYWNRLNNVWRYLATRSGSYSSTPYLTICYPRSCRWFGPGTIDAAHAAHPGSRHFQPILVVTSLVQSYPITKMKKKTMIKTAFGAICPLLIQSRKKTRKGGARWGMRPNPIGIKSRVTAKRKEKKRKRNDSQRQQKKGAQGEGRICVCGDQSWWWLFNRLLHANHQPLPLAFICVVNVRLKEEKEHLNVGLFRLE